MFPVDWFHIIFTKCTKLSSRKSSCSRTNKMHTALSYEVDTVFTGGNKCRSIYYCSRNSWWHRAYFFPSQCVRVLCVWKGLYEFQGDLISRVLCLEIDFKSRCGTNRIECSTMLQGIYAIVYDVWTGMRNGVLGRGSENVHVCGNSMCVNN